VPVLILNPGVWTRTCAKLLIRQRELARDAVRVNASVDNACAWTKARQQVRMVDEQARRRCFRSFVEQKLNRRSALGHVTNVLRRMEGAAQGNQPGKAVNGDNGRLLLTDMIKRRLLLLPACMPESVVRLEPLNKIAR
jgi:hypothetical protein